MSAHSVDTLHVLTLSPAQLETVRDALAMLNATDADALLEQLPAPAPTRPDERQWKLYAVLALDCEAAHRYLRGLAVDGDELKLQSPYVKLTSPSRRCTWRYIADPADARGLVFDSMVGLPGWTGRYDAQRLEAAVLVAKRRARP